MSLTLIFHHCKDVFFLKVDIVARKYCFHDFLSFEEDNVCSKSGDPFTVISTGYIGKELSSVLHHSVFIQKDGRFDSLRESKTASVLLPLLP